MKKSVVAVLSVGLLSACASVFDGTTQDIVVNTNPPGANCVLEREGAAIGSIPSTPGSTTIQ